MAEEHDSWLAGLGIDVQRIWAKVESTVEEGRKKLEGAKSTAEEAKKVADADYGSDTKTESHVDPGAAEESLKDFAQDVKATSKKLKQAKTALDKLKGEAGMAKALGETSHALDQVAEGLDKVGEGADKVLKVAAAMRKLEECRQVLVRVEAVDFTQADRRVENAKAMGDLAKLFGEFGVEATKQVPMLKGYFQLISRLGEIWVPFARMVDRREKEALDAADGSDRVQAPPEAKGIAADTSRVIALEDVPDFLEKQWELFDRSGESREARRARDILADHDFDANFKAFLADIERSHGAKAEALHFIAEKTPLELPGEKYLQDDLARDWKPCYEAVVALRDEFDRRWNWMGVTYEPAVRALEAARPKKG